MRFSFFVLRVLLRFKAFHYSFNENQIEKRIELKFSGCVTSHQ